MQFIGSKCLLIPSESGDQLGLRVIFAQVCLCVSLSPFMYIFSSRLIRNMIAIPTPYHFFGSNILYLPSHPLPPPNSLPLTIDLACDP